MTEQAGSRGISIGGSAAGQFNTGDNSVQVSRHGFDGEALKAFVTLMSRELGDIALSEEQQSGAQAALAEIDELASSEQADPGKVRTAFERFVSFLAQAGRPALTAAFMTLALHLGVAAPPK
jgi:hypothetical protein